jgi:hypothetical protein
MIKQAKDITAMIVDTSGNYVSLAARLAKEYKRVLYSNPSWVESYANPNKIDIGEGIEGIEVVKNPFDEYDKIDFWIFPDVYYGSFQEFLKSQGEITWGSGIAEELELEREIVQEKMADLGLPTLKYKMIHGMDNLRLYLQGNPEKWVKLNHWRGLIETFFSSNYELVKPELDDIEFCRGIDVSKLDFMVCDPIDGSKVREKGYDGATIAGKYPTAWISGFEKKDKLYIGKWKKYSELSKTLTDFPNAFADEFKMYDYRGFFSLENRISGKVSTMSDFTARVPCPPGFLYQAGIKNIGEFIWAGANGEMIEPVPAALFFVELLMESDWSKTRYCNVFFPKENAEFIKLKRHMIDENGINKIVPLHNGQNDIGSILGMGDTLEAARLMAVKVTNSIEGTEISMKKELLDNIEDEFNEMDAL